MDLLLVETRGIAGPVPNRVTVDVRLALAQDVAVLVLDVPADLHLLPMAMAQTLLPDGGSRCRQAEGGAVSLQRRPSRSTKNRSRLLMRIEPV